MNLDHVKIPTREDTCATSARLLPSNGQPPCGDDNIPTTANRRSASRLPYTNKAASPANIIPALATDPSGTLDDSYNVVTQPATPVDPLLTDEGRLNLDSTCSDSEGPHVPCFRRVRQRRAQTTDTVSAPTSQAPQPPAKHTARRLHQRRQRKQSLTTLFPESPKRRRPRSLVILDDELACHDDEAVPLLLRPDHHVERSSMKYRLSSNATASGVVLTIDLPPLPVDLSEISLKLYAHQGILPPKPETAMLRPATTKPSRIGNRYSQQEDRLLLRLRCQENPRLSWTEIEKHFPNRSQGSLQVRFSTHLNPSRYV